MEVNKKIMRRTITPIKRFVYSFRDEAWTDEAEKIDDYAWCLITKNNAGYVHPDDKYEVLQYDDLVSMEDIIKEKIDIGIHDEIVVEIADTIQYGEYE